MAISPRPSASLMAARVLALPMLERQSERHVSLLNSRAPRKKGPRSGEGRTAHQDEQL